MTKQKIIYSLVNLVNNFDLDLSQREVLLNYFSRVVPVDQVYIYDILINNPDFIQYLINFIKAEEIAVTDTDGESLSKVFALEFQKIKDCSQSSK